MNKLTLIVFVIIAAAILYYVMWNEIFVHIDNPLVQAVLPVTIFIFIILAIYGGKKYAQGSTSLKTDEVLYPMNSRITGTLIFNAHTSVTVEKAKIVLQCAEKGMDLTKSRNYIYFKPLPINKPIYTQTLDFDEKRSIQKGEEITFEFSFDIPDSMHKELDRKHKKSSLVWRLRSDLTAGNQTYKDIAFFSIDGYS